MGDAADAAEPPRANVNDNDDDEASQKPTVLLVLSSMRADDDTPEWRDVLSRFNVIHYDCATVEEFCARLRQPDGGPYGRIDAILRTGWLKAGPYAQHALFRGEPITLLPPSLRFIGCSGHGYDAADIPALSARGVAYANTPDTCTEAVANTGLSLILNVYRKFTLAEHLARQQQSGHSGWADSRVVGEVAVDPCGQVLGVVGLGDIGLAAARKAALALDMEIHYHNRRGPRPDLEAQLPRGATYHDSVASLLQAADCVFLACPLTPETHHMISAESLAAVAHKKIRIVNIARGGLIDEDALLDAMDSGQVVGVGLDVHANEPGVNPRLADNYNVTVLPHIGVASHTSWKRFDEVNLKNLIEFFFGDKNKVTLVNQDRLERIQNKE
ncbi:hypothetical protein SLS62_009938 [Diatrype stigma]|uniref:Glyoxylate reductase n=1 Tax=Diatrype stigma TaxID=117547 RepID=A0AAN9UJ54_9PEZI